MRLTVVILFVYSTLSVIAGRQADSLQVHKWARQAVEFRNGDKLINAIVFSKKAIALAEKAKLNQDYIHNKLYNFLANRYSNIGDFDRAIEIGKSLELYYQKTGNQRRRLNTINNLGVYHQNIARYDIAYRYFLEGWKNDENKGSVIDQLDWLDGLTASCLKLGNILDAKLYSDRASQLIRSYNGKYKEELLVHVKFNYAQLLMAKGRDSEALQVYRQVASSSDKLELRKGVDARINAAQLLLKNENFQPVLFVLDGVIDYYNLQENKGLKDPYLFQVKYLQALASSNLGQDEQALTFVDLAEEQAAFFHEKYRFNESKFFLDEIRRKNLELGVKVAFSLWQKTNKSTYAQMALLYSEKAKSNVLSERMSTARKLRNENVSDDIKSLRIELVYELNNLKNGGQTNEAIQVRDKLDSLDNSLGLGTSDTDFDNLILEVQNSLNDGFIILSFLFIDSSLYKFQVSNDNIVVSYIEARKREYQDLYYLLQSRSEVNVSSIKELLPEDSQLKSLSHITIIPDGALNYLPFELVYIDSGYENITFSYDFSLQSYAEVHTYKNSGKYIGFAPDFSLSGNLAYLKNGEQSLTNARSLFGGRSFLGPQASTVNFRSSGLRSSILHLYTHGVSNDSSYDASYIYFQDRKMYVDEILTMPFETDLCLLTACEVGLGKEFSGEGVTGIAWAFKGSGAANVVQSLWKLNEQSSSVLMDYFFKHLSQGMSSEQALAKAKQDYLADKSISRKLKHPYHWAGICHYGRGIALPQQSSAWKGILGFFIAITAYAAIRFYGKRAAKRVA